MDTSPDRLLQINRLLLTSIGLWPYQSGLNRICWFIFTIIFLATQGLLQTGGMIAAWCDTPVFMESIAPVLISVMCLIKFINFIYNADKMKMLLDTIKSDWSMVHDEGEKKILYNWAADSKKSTVWYAAMVYGTMIPFMLGPLVPIILSIIPQSSVSNDTNFTDDRVLMYHVEYMIDIDKYYLPVLIDSYFGTMTYITVVVAIDSMFMVYAQHACAIFEIIGYQLGQLVDDDNNDLAVNIYPSLKDDQPYKRIIKCIIRHAEALKYAQLIESANSMSFLLQLGLNMVCISFTGFQAATKLNHPDEAMRYASFTIAQTFHLFFESWPSQRLADESAKIREYTFVFSFYYEKSLSFISNGSSST